MNNIQQYVGLSQKCPARCYNESKRNLYNHQAKFGKHEILTLQQFQQKLKIDSKSWKRAQQCTTHIIKIVNNEVKLFQEKLVKFQQKSKIQGCISTSDEQILKLYGKIQKIRFAEFSCKEAYSVYNCIQKEQSSIMEAVKQYYSSIYSCIAQQLKQILQSIKVYIKKQRHETEQLIKELKNKEIERKIQQERKKKQQERKRQQQRCRRQQQRKKQQQKQRLQMQNKIKKQAESKFNKLEYHTPTPAPKPQQYTSISQILAAKEGYFTIKGKIINKIASFTKDHKQMILWKLSDGIKYIGFQCLKSHHLRQNDTIIATMCQIYFHLNKKNLTETAKSQIKICQQNSLRKELSSTVVKTTYIKQRVQNFQRTQRFIKQKTKRYKTELTDREIIKKYIKSNRNFIKRFIKKKSIESPSKFNDRMQNRPKRQRIFRKDQMS